MELTKWLYTLSVYVHLPVTISQILTVLLSNYYDLHLTQALRGLAQVKTERIVGR